MLKTTRKIKLIILFGIIVAMSIHMYKNDSIVNTEQFKYNIVRRHITLSDFTWNDSVFINNGTDEGRDLVLDSFGNVFVTGKIMDSSKNAYDTILIKYNSGGDIEWNKTWGGSSDDAGLSIDVDASNNIYVAGWTKSFGVNDSYDVSLLKFDNNGLLLWAQTWGGDKKDTGHGIVVDSSNIYVVGFTKENLDYGDAVVLKFDDSGALLWNKTWGQGGTKSDGAYDVDVDGSGNIYVTGYCESYGAVHRDLFLAKFDSNGNLLDNKTWGDDNWSDTSSLIVGSDSIYVVGNKDPTGSAGNNIILRKFNLAGFNFQWNTTWGGNENNFGYDIALDSEENIYIIGSIEDVDKTRACMVKFDNSGVYQWHKKFSNGIQDVGLAIIIDSSNSQYFTGKTTMLDSDNDIFLLKVFSSPTDFDLTTDASRFDTDGAFNLFWTESLGADNYTLYQSDEKITINSSLVEIVSGNTNRTYSIKNLVRGIYYYKVISFNKYGNASSNSIRVVVQFPPDLFALNQPLPVIDTDGTIILSWSSSSGALNYSVYVNNTFINNINNKGNLIQEGLINNSCLAGEELIDGVYYFVVVASNEVGQTMSNCVSVNVQKQPSQFTLSKEIDTETVDDDGLFFLSWTQSKFAGYYVIYNSSTPMNESDSDIKVLDTFAPDFVWPEYRYQINVSENGKYYYRVDAVNSYGNFSSNYVEVEVAITSHAEPPWPPDLLLILLIILIISGVVAGVAVSLYYFRRKRRRDLDEKDIF